MNYKIIGGDQKEYGPVTPDELRIWIAEGRANRDTLVQPEGSAEWRALFSFPELAALLTPQLATTAPSTVAAQPAFAGGQAVDAAAAVRIPAIILIVAGGLSILGAIVGIIQHATGAGMPTLPPDLPPQVAQFVDQYIKTMRTIGLPMAIVNMILSALVLFGGLSMLKLQRWGWALAACIIGLACANPCCCPVGMVAGIWGLVQLCKTEIKSCFH